MKLRQDLYHLQAGEKTKVLHVYILSYVSCYVANNCFVCKNIDTDLVLLSSDFPERSIAYFSPQNYSLAKILTISGKSEF